MTGSAQPGQNRVVLRIETLRQARVIGQIENRGHAGFHTREWDTRQHPAHFPDTAAALPASKIENMRLRCYLACIKRHPEDPFLSLTELSAIAARPARPEPAPITAQAILDLVLSSLDDDKAEDIVTIDLRGKSSMADHMVVASGRSTRQVAAIAQKLMDRLKETFRLSARVEGKEVGDWVLIDTGDVVVHIFRPEVREFYQLEKMWQDVGTPRPVV